MFIAVLFSISRTWKWSRCPLTDEWIKKLWYRHTVEYYSAIKRDAFQSVLIKWMNLEPVMQSAGSQKKKNKYHILKRIYGIWNDGTDEPICRAAVETQTQRTDLWTQWGKERVGRTERVAWKRIHPTRKTDGQRECAMWLRELHPVFCDHLQGWDGDGGGTEAQGGGDKWIPMADSHWRVAETNTML